jgi:3-phenylpropionate/cinnamic acid dioxygenase small subunit
MSKRSLEERIDELESRAAINELLAEYCRGCDTNDEEAFIAIWHDDAQYPLGPLFGEFKGHDGIREAIHIIWDALPTTRHWTTNAVITFQDADHARSRSDVTFECTDTQGRFLSGAATYHDEFERRDGVWKFTKRVVDTQYRNLVEVANYDAA